MAEREKLAHLLRRATFGPTAEEVDAAERDGLEATIARLVGPSDPNLGPAIPVITSDSNNREAQITTITNWWVDRMVAAGSQLEEKMTFFWHGHWATSIEKVDSPHLMMLQHNTFRRYGQSDFSAFVKAMIRDPALILWLDGQRNTKKAPNENLARELLELFCLGIGNYTEDDVKAGARALTGWVVDRGSGKTRLDMSRYDSGDKTILGSTGKFDADGFADVLLNLPASQRFVARRLWFRFASGDPMPEEVLHKLVGAYSAGKGITTMLIAMFGHPAFLASRSQLVKQPLEWVCGAMRQLGLRPSTLAENDRKQLMSSLDGLDQVPFRPPSVGGWPHGAAWLTSHSIQVRLRLAEMLAARTPNAVLAKLNDVPQQGRPDALARLLVVDAWTPRTRAVLDGAAKDSRKVLALGLVSPEYSVH